VLRVALRNPIAGKLGEEFDRVFDRLLAPRLHTEPLLPPFPFESAGAEWMPVMDVIETAEGYVVRLEAPGIHKENLDINLVGEILTITGKREITPEVEGEGYLVREQAIGRFVRTIRLPLPVAEKKVTAEYRDGVLMVQLPKDEPAPATKVVIK
jgi:HSP20 family protein